MQNIICMTGRFILGLRYHVKISGLEKIKQPEKSSRGILFLASHPALIDPFILLVHLYPHFKCRTLGDEDQLSRPGLSWWADKFGVIRLPDVATHGTTALAGAKQSLDKCGQLLARGENILLYPAGHIMRSRTENIGGNSGIETLLKAAPDARVVFIRTRGLWGSAFSRASGRYPDIKAIARRAVKALLVNAIFFMPKREVEITMHEPKDFPATAGRLEMNSFIENFLNQDAPPNTYVPYSRLERGGIRALPEPEKRKADVKPDKIPTATKKLVLEKLTDLTGSSDIDPRKNLSKDLGLDSLSRLELVIWIEQEFGFQVSNPDMLETVTDVFAAAAGESLVGRVDSLIPVPDQWFKRRPSYSAPDITIPSAGTLTAAFLQTAAAQPGMPILADQSTGVKTYRDIITALLVLKPLLEQIPGKHIGIMMPAAAISPIMWLASLFAGKTPVLFNWTVGERHINHMKNLLNIETILTSRKLVVKLKSQGVKFGTAEETFSFIEDLAGNVSLFHKLRAKLFSYISWRTLQSAPVPETAAILFTSGSESMPKAVPLTHQNLFANIRDIKAVKALRPSDIFIGFLPPFHSFGLTITVILPLIAGLRTVYHSNPTEGGILARLISHYKVSVMPGTPTFLNGILKGAGKNDLTTLRIGVTGAEKCPEHVYNSLQRMCPDMKILEGYGITECSPVVSVNRPENPVPFSIGRIMDSLEYVILDEPTGKPCPPGQQGILLVRGPSVFNGYLHHDGASPFVEYQGHEYYRTGDLVEENQDGILFFKGRLKRFIKLGGEMISLPAIEEILIKEFSPDNSDGPVLAVESISEDTPEVTLFTTIDITRDSANKTIRNAGLSSLHNIRSVVKVENIPVLGTGKTDYRTLKTRLDKE